MRELLVGAGRSREKLVFDEAHKEWDDLVTLDIDPDSGADVQHDLQNLPYPFSDEMFDEIHAYNVLEHTGALGDYRFFFAQFAEFGRITRPGGMFFGAVPHERSVWLWGDPGHTRTITREMLLFLDDDFYGPGKTQSDSYRPLLKYPYRMEWCNMDVEHNLIAPNEHLLFALRKK